MTKTEVLQRIKGLDEKTQKKMVCALAGHSRIQTTFFGYFYCGRCGEQVGDKLAASYDSSQVVVVGHDCQQCHENAKAFTWKDTLLAPDPFVKEKVTP